MQQQDYELLRKFGKLVRKLRTKQSKSLNQFAFNSDLFTSATLSRIENGLVDLKFSTFIKLANALNIKPEELVHGFDFKYDID